MLEAVRRRTYGRSLGILERGRRRSGQLPGPFSFRPMPGANGSATSTSQLSPRQTRVGMLSRIAGPCRNAPEPSLGRRCRRMAGALLPLGAKRALTVNAGDKMLIGKYSGSEVKLEGKDQISIGEDDVLAILDE
jgi:chaperonin GroES